MKNTRNAILAVVLLAAAGVPAVRSAEHVVSPRAIDGILADAARQRQTDLATVTRTLSSPAARSVERLGLDVAAARRALAGLTDAELADLAARARALDVDPAAGRLRQDTEDLLVIFLIVAIVILVLKAVD